MIQNIKEKIRYLFFGVLTTIVSFASFGLLNDFFNMDYRVSTVGSWIAAVAFAFITNKLFVFQSKSFEFVKIVRELGSFVAARLISLGFEFGWMILVVELFNMNEYLAKILASIVVVICNYFFSKMFIFKSETKQIEE